MAGGACMRCGDKYCVWSTTLSPLFFTMLSPPLFMPYPPPAPHLEHNLLHLLIGCLELPLEHDHALTCVVEGVLRVHQWDDEANGLEERSKHLTAQRPGGRVGGGSGAGQGGAGGYSVGNAVACALMWCVTVW